MTQEVKLLHLSDIRPNNYNFRTVFDGLEFDEIVASINVHGVIQPNLARPNEANTSYEIVFGERR